MEITKIIVEEAAQALTMGDASEGIEIVAEIPKSLHTPRKMKEKQVMVPIRVSPWNLLCTKLLMEEKGKVITIETDEEEEYLEDLIIIEYEDEGMEVDIAYTLCEKTTHLCPPAKREGQSAQGPGRDQEFAPNPAPPR